MRILVVDDDEIGRTKLEVLLHAFGSCDTAQDGAAALAMFQAAHTENAPYDLITMDIVMPAMHGQEVVHRIREWERAHPDKVQGKEAKILMITAKDDIKNISSSFWEGCQGYLPKPVTPDNLAEQLDKLYIYPIR